MMGACKGQAEPVAQPTTHPPQQEVVLSWFSFSEKGKEVRA
jgi:hypothetical protein